jgi:hypothetical protein
MNINAAFQWVCQPKAEKFVLDFVEYATQSNQAIADLQSDLLHHTSTRLFDWLDHIVVADTSQNKQNLLDSGYVVQKLDTNDLVYHHPGAQLPRVVIRKNPQDPVGLAVSVDQISDFIMAHGGLVHPHIEGSIFGNYRRCHVHRENDVVLWVVERRGTQTIQPTTEDPQTVYTYLKALELWQTRPRALDNENEAMDQTIKLAEELVKMVGRDRAAWTVLEVERRYWQLRNTAGQIQKNRQDHYGMGWANHDHHTFRSSRSLFSKLVHLFEILGFHCRERYHAGEEAGWGAQIMENPVCRLVLFLDVDLAAHEIEGDIAHEPLPKLDHLGTIGLWCALHGDSILKAGMHHLEAQFMFDELTHDLSKSGIKMMFPFSSFPYLRQAFTVGEMWPVDPNRIQKTLIEGKITPEQAEKFRTEGALGSHLENLQRREGYKGFNQKNVSIIIKKTDPRKQG